MLSRVRLFTCGLFAVCLLLFCAPAKAAYSDGLYAEVTTNRGLIVLQLEFEKTPMTAANFVGLAEGTIKNEALPEGTPFFDGTKWHRVVPGHVIQCGIPKDGKAQVPGYLFPNEIRLPELNHDRAGMVNMANAGPHTNDCQWCIMLGDRSYLDGDYTVFGHVVEGMDVVFKIVQGDEIKSVKIVRVGKAAEAFRPTTESFMKMVEAAKERVKKDDAQRKQAEDQLTAAMLPKAVDGEKGLKYVIDREGSGAAPAQGARLKIAYSGFTLLYGLKFASSADGTPCPGDKPETFVFELGKTKINPGIDAMVAQMRKGEKRTLIVPAAEAYGTSGFYAKERKGEKRFVISPNTVLVYKIELLDVE